MAIGRLHGREREALALRFGAELSVGEIAELIDRTPAEVKQRLARGVRMLIELRGIAEGGRARKSAAKRPGAGGSEQGKAEKREADRARARATWTPRSGAPRPDGPAATRASRPGGGAGRCARSSSPTRSNARPRPGRRTAPARRRALRPDASVGQLARRGRAGGAARMRSPRARREDQQEREQEAHSAVTVGREEDWTGGLGIGWAFSCSGGRFALASAAAALPSAPSWSRAWVALDGLACRGAAAPAAPAVVRTAAAAAVRYLLEVLVALRRPGRDRDRCAGDDRRQRADREHAEQDGSRRRLT